MAPVMVFMPVRGSDLVGTAVPAAVLVNFCSGLVHLVFFGLADGDWDWSAFLRFFVMLRMSGDRVVLPRMVVVGLF